MRYIGLLICLLWLSSTVESAWADGYALIVGANDCPKFVLPGGTKPHPLRGAEADADAIAKILIDQYGFAVERVLVLKGAEATREKVRAAFVQLQTQLRPDDRFVFHFSGHGTQVADRRPFDEADDLDEALCVHDAQADGTNLIYDDELGLWLDDLPASRITVLLDCCHAGTGIKGDDAEFVPRFLPSMAIGKRPDHPEQPWGDLRPNAKDLHRRMSAFFACRADQQAYERRIPAPQANVRGGQFTHYLLEGLRDRKADRDGNGMISNQEALDYASGRLEETFNRIRPRPAERQQPTLESDAADAPLFSDLGEKPSSK